MSNSTLNEKLMECNTVRTADIVEAMNYENRKEIAVRMIKDGLGNLQIINITGLTYGEVQHIRICAKSK